MDCLSLKRTDAVCAAKIFGRILGRGSRGDFGRGVALIILEGDTNEEETSDEAAACEGFAVKEVRFRRARTGRGKCSYWERRFPLEVSPPPLTPTAGATIAAIYALDLKESVGFKSSKRERDESFEEDFRSVARVQEAIW